MVGEEASRSVVKRLKAAGFRPKDAKGSHPKWVHPSGVKVVVADGHRTISPGVVRQVNTAIRDSEAAS